MLVAVLVMWAATKVVCDAQDPWPIKIFKTRIYSMDARVGIPILGEARFGAFNMIGYADGRTSARFTELRTSAPSGQEYLFRVDIAGYGFYLDEDFREQRLLDENFTNGTYTVSATTTNGTNDQVSLDLTENEYPGSIRINNLIAAQSVNPTNDFTLTWDPIPGALATDRIRVNFDVDFAGGQPTWDAPDLFGTNTLPGTATSLTIPTAALTNITRNHSANITIYRISQLATNAGGTLMGAIGHASSTTFQLGIAGTTNDYPVYPGLQSLSPTIGDTNIPVNTVFTLTFWSSLDTNVNLAEALVWTGIPDTNNFDYSWDTNGTRLFCRYHPALPAGAEIGFGFAGNLVTNSFRPTSTARRSPSLETRFTTTNGTPITVSSAFTNLTYTTASNGVAVGPDIEWYAAGKTRHLEQQGGTITHRRSAAFECSARMSGRPSAAGIAVTMPDGTIVSDAYIDYLGVSTQLYSASFELGSAEDLDRFVPDGTYGLTMDTHYDGLRTVSLEVTNANYPNDPLIANHQAALVINPTNDFVVQWHGITNPGPDDIVALRVLNVFNRVVYQTPGLNEFNALPGSSTERTIPAGTLSPGRAFRCELAYVKVVNIDTNSYPGVVGLTYFTKVTSAPIQTTGSRRPLRLNWRSSTNGSHKIQLDTEPMARYLLEFSNNLRNWYTTTSFSTEADGATEHTDFTVSNSTLPAFYRIREDHSDTYRGSRVIRQPFRTVALPPQSAVRPAAPLLSGDQSAAVIILREPFVPDPFPPLAPLSNQ